MTRLPRSRPLASGLVVVRVLPTQCRVFLLTPLLMSSIKRDAMGQAGDSVRRGGRDVLVVAVGRDRSG